MYMHLKTHTRTYILLEIDMKYIKSFLCILSDILILKNSQNNSISIIFCLIVKKFFLKKKKKKKRRSPLVKKMIVDN